MASRGCHYKPSPSTAAYKQGQGQAEVSMTRYHMLYAALQRKCTVVSSPLGRQTIDFAPYHAFTLEPLSDVKLHPRSDGSIHPGDLEIYHSGFEDNWKTQEGGLLYCVGFGPEFFNCILNYHSPAQTTGSQEWDELSHKLERMSYPKEIIPCMFFGREAGCMDGNCPFLHDKMAVQENRARVLAKRREKFDGKPTARQWMDRRRILLNTMAGNDPTARGNLSDSGRLDEIQKDELAYCANPQCLKPWKRQDEVCPLQRCQKCKFTMYCSASTLRNCQKSDWKRHKKEPCAPIEDIIANDDLWNPIGTRKGTESFSVDWGYA
ncbi:hypothetical protein K439DRAFT_1346235 [Ramaria rubella]|nr:hypothetical protein K439DRAFT_1346235 [Ramaria rubella]